jgi:hypothetical protein
MAALTLLLQRLPQLLAMGWWIAALLLRLCSSSTLSGRLMAVLWTLQQLLQRQCLSAAQQCSLTQLVRLASCQLQPAWRHPPYHPARQQQQQLLLAAAKACMLAPR